VVAQLTGPVLNSIEFLKNWGILEQVVCPRGVRPFFFDSILVSGGHMERGECIIKIVSGEKYTPFALAEKLGARCILESSSFDKGKERYSVLLIREAFQLVQVNKEVLMLKSGDNSWYRVKSRARDILDVCLYFANQHTSPEQGFPFPAGGIGYLSYEFARFCDTLSYADQLDPLGLPDAAYLFGHVFVICDHYTDMLYLIGLNYKEAQIDLETELSELEHLIRYGESASFDLGLDFASIDNADPALGEGDSETYILHEASDDDETYKAGVEAVKQEIIAGNLLQGVLSRRLCLYSSINALEAYRQLRSNNPSPYLFYLDFGNYQIFGSSPEVHVKVKDGEALLRPIAGTRRRGKSKSEDLSLETEMLSDPKERAEHLMLVDLGRNDLGRVCEPGSVRVSEYMTVERYSHVMHMVSQVEGKIGGKRNGLDVLRATFPAGTVSGAPKLRAIEILSRLEKCKRRFYAGALGYMEPGGNMDTCIGIRAGLKAGKRLVLQAGAGIVYDSTPERELEETREKMSALMRACGLDPNKALEDYTEEHPPVEDDLLISIGYSQASAVEADIKTRNITEESDSFSIQENIDDLVGSKDEYPLIDPEALQPQDDDAAQASMEDTEIIPLEWDFDPAEASATGEIQDEIDSLIQGQSGSEFIQDLDAEQEKDSDQGASE